MSHLFQLQSGGIVTGGQLSSMTGNHLWRRKSPLVKVVCHPRGGSPLPLFMPVPDYPASTPPSSQQTAETMSSLAIAQTSEDESAGPLDSAALRQQLVEQTRREDFNLPWLSGPSGKKELAAIFG